MIYKYDEFINEGLKDVFLKIVDKLINKFGKSFVTEKSYRDYMVDLSEDEIKDSRILDKISSIDKDWVEENKSKKNYNTLLANKIKDSLSENDYNKFIEFFK